MRLCECGSETLVCPRCGAGYRHAQELVMPSQPISTKNKKFQQLGAIYCRRRRVAKNKEASV
jgi:hypothetical protein